jgi:hypothetical protein
MLVSCISQLGLSQQHNTDYMAKQQKFVFSWKSKIKEPSGVVSGLAALPDLQITTFL